jgi:3-deoxy-D-manno-octulosonic-acid transferase
MLYNLAIRVWCGAIRLAATWSPKARAWCDGRTDWRSRYTAQLAQLPPAGHTLWLHAASLGEFEQGRPIIEAWRAECPEWRIILTFYSPSGYQVRHNYAQVDWVGYLPADTPQNARDFVQIIRPDAVIFVKYEFWYNVLSELNRRDIPVALVSAVFRPNQPFFAWYGSFWRRMLRTFDRVMVQDERSGKLLQRIDYQGVDVAGDTRVDRVLQLTDQAPSHTQVELFAGATCGPILVVGSSWPEDEALVWSVLHRAEFADFRLIIAPHEPSKHNVEQLLRTLKCPTVRLSEVGTLAEGWQHARALIIDNIGLLNTLYKYGTVAYIGGGFGSGIHNTLEPAAWGLPVVFGPKYQKFEEAKTLIQRGGFRSVKSADELAQALIHFEVPDNREHAQKAIRKYLLDQKGATERALHWLRRFAK